jgi:hypothetical protein
LSFLPWLLPPVLAPLLGAVASFSFSLSLSLSLPVEEAGVGAAAC